MDFSLTSEEIQVCNFKNRSIILKRYIISM